MILDHLLVLPRGLDSAQRLCTSTLGAADAFSARLAGAGFAEGSSRAHPGQGTANRRLFLDNLMIECLLVDDQTALDATRGAALALGSRFRDPSASGVGIAFRPGPDSPDDLPATHLAWSAYRPPYLPEALHIDVASGFDVDVPLLFHLPFARRRAAVPPDGEPRSHPNGARRVTGVAFERPAALPDSVRAVLESTGTRCGEGLTRECLHVRLAGLDPGVELDLRPSFPLRLHA